MMRTAILAAVVLLSATAARAADFAPLIGLTKIHAVDYVVLALYFASVLIVGYLASAKGETSVRGYFKGENSMSALPAGLSLMATRLSAVTFISIPAKAYSSNWTYWLLPFSNIAIAYVLSRWVIPFYVRLDMTSIYEYLERRFDWSVRMLGSCVFVFLESARLSVLILVPALVVTVVIDVNLTACIIAIGVVTTISTVIGGIKGVVWVDVFQAVLMLTGAVLCIATALHAVPDPFAALSQAASNGKFKIVEPSLDLSKASLAVIIIYWISEIKNYVANQTNAQRFMVTKDVSSAQRSIWIGSLTMVGTITLCMFVGTALYLFYQEHPERLNPAAKSPDELVPWFIVHEVPPGLAGLTLAAVFSAAMSSLNSSLNSISSVVVTDFFGRWGRHYSDATGVRVGKRVIWISGIAATVLGVIMAHFKIDSLFDQLIEILGLFGGGLGGVFLLGIFTRRANSRGVWIGFATSCVVLLCVKLLTQIHVLTYLTIGMVSCFAVGYGVSRLSKRPIKDLTGLTVVDVKSSLHGKRAGR